MNLSNNDRQPSAERVEGRSQIEENIYRPCTHLTQSKERVSQGLAGVRTAARGHKKMKFTALLHHMTVGLLGKSFLRAKAKSGSQGGRIHRFLVDHILSKLGFTPPGILFPVFAAMLRDRMAYDQVLEGFSASIMPFIHYDLDPEHERTVQNDIAHLYRYFDATSQAEYLYCCIEETVYHDLRDEIGFLTAFDAVLCATVSSGGDSACSTQGHDAGKTHCDLTRWLGTNLPIAQSRRDCDDEQQQTLRS